MAPTYHPEPTEQNQPAPVPTTPVRSYCPQALFCTATTTSVLVAVFIARLIYPGEASDLRSLDDPFVISSIAPQASQCGCPYLAIFPFDAGCPTDCASHRIGLASNTDFYNTNMSLVLYNLTSFRQQQQQNISIPTEAPLAQSFVALEKAVIDSVTEKVKQAKLPPLSIHRQSLIQMSLDYLCCLTEPERAVAQDVRTQFVQHYYNHFPLELGRVHCFHEQVDSFTLIWMADALAQKLLMRANRALANAMRARGVPVLVDRTLQMPFHVTLMALKVAPGQDVSSYRKVIQAAVEASGSHSVSTLVTSNNQLAAWELSRGSIELNYAAFGEVEKAKWFAQEECDA